MLTVLSILLVYETCGREYTKTRDKLVKVEEQVTELRAQIEAAQGEADEEFAETLKEKTGALMGGRASNERKWRDSQVAFANILKVRYGLVVIAKLCSIVSPHQPHPQFLRADDCYESIL